MKLHSIEDRRISLIYAACLIGVGLSVLCGWYFNIRSLKSILPSFITMKANTATMFVALGLGTFIRFSRIAWKIPLSKIFFMTPAIMGIAVLIEYGADINLGIDELLFKDLDGISGKFPPGRMAPISALCFIALSIASLCAESEKGVLSKLSHFLIFLTFLMAFQAMVGYFLGLTYNFGYAYFTQMAFHTALLFVLASFATLQLCRDSRIWLLLRAQTPGGVLLRRLLILSLVTPTLANLIAIKGYQFGLFDENYSVLLRVLGSSALFTWLVWKNTIAMHYAEMQRLSAVTEAQELENQQRLIEISKSEAETVRRSEARLRAIFENAHDAVISMDEKGLIVDWNPKAEVVFGWSKQEVLGKSLTELIIPQKYRNFYEESLKRFLQTREPTFINKSLEHIAVRRSGEEFPIQLSITPILLDEGFLFTAFIADITERKQAESDLEMARVAALSAAKTKAEFLANMSHEIRTPLNGIIGMTDLLLDTPLDENQKRFVRLLQDSGSGLLTIVNDILDFSKIEAGKMRLENIVFDLATLLEAQTDFLMLRAREKGLVLHCFIDPKIPRSLIGDPGRIGQVLLNLMSNALKFTEQGSVFVKALLMSESAENVSIKLSVLDTGIGLSEENAAKLFQPFVQADGSTARKYGGTGLGLSISKRIVNLMGGEIGLISKLGQGAEFWFQLELPIAAHTSQRDRGADLHPENLLIIDQDPIACDIVRSYAESWNLNCKASATRDLIKEHLMAADVILVQSMSAAEDELFGEKLRNLGFKGKLLLSRASVDKLIKSQYYELEVARPFRQSDLYEALFIDEKQIAHLDIKQESNDLSQLPSDRARILVAEDNNVNQLLAVNILRKLGFSTQVVANGQEALQALSQSNFDLVLMDCQMPEMDGFEATLAIRKLGYKLPIIALTANALAEDRDRCLNAGMDDYLAKPIKRDQLREILEKWLSKKQVA